MTPVEQEIHHGFQWAEPENGKELKVEQRGQVIEISGLFPTYSTKDSPCDLIHQFDQCSKNLAKVGQIGGAQSPGISFANADTDQKLVAFVKQFGPVVAKRVKDTRLIPDAKTKKPDFPGWLIAQQDMDELRKEQAVYRAALALVHWLETDSSDSESAEGFIEIIAEGIKDWTRQWEREQSLRKAEPSWMLRESSFKRMPRPHAGAYFPDALTGRVVMCELLNSFPSTTYPNLLEMHASIKFGIRPLLYSILRRQFLHPRGFSICPNTECRRFFNIERAGQEFCDAECSRRQRQRDYWQTIGKKRREKRNAKHRKRDK